MGLEQSNTNKDSKFMGLSGIPEIFRARGFDIDSHSIPTGLMLMGEGTPLPSFFEISGYSPESALGQFATVVYAEERLMQGLSIELRRRKQTDKLPPELVNLKTLLETTRIVRKELGSQIFQTHAEEYTTATRSVLHGGTIRKGKSRELKIERIKDLASKINKNFPLTSR